MMAKKNSDDDGGIKCPVCELLDALCAKCGRLRSSEFAQHLRNARTEVLMAVRSIINERIEALKDQGAPKPRSRRIKVKAAE